MLESQKKGLPVTLTTSLVAIAFASSGPPPAIGRTIQVRAIHLNFCKQKVMKSENEGIAIVIVLAEADILPASVRKE